MSELESLLKELQDLRQRTEKLERFAQNVRLGYSDKFILPKESIFLALMGKEWRIQSGKPKHQDVEEFYLCPKAPINIKKWLQGQISKEAFALIDSVRIKVRNRNKTISLGSDSEPENECEETDSSDESPYWEGNEIFYKVLIIINEKYSYSCRPKSRNSKLGFFDLTDFFNQTFQRILLEQE